MSVISSRHMPKMIAKYRCYRFPNVGRPMSPILLMKFIFCLLILCLNLILQVRIHSLFRIEIIDYARDDNKVVVLLLIERTNVRLMWVSGSVLQQCSNYRGIYFAHYEIWATRLVTLIPITGIGSTFLIRISKLGV